MLDSDKIIAFVKKNQKRERTRWIDIEKEFCINRKWSKGKFVNNWKDAKPYLEKRPTKNWSRGMYFVKEPWDEEATKYILTGELKDQKLNIVKIPKEMLEKNISVLAKHYRDRLLKDYGILTRRKLKSSFKNLFLQYLERNIREKSKFWSMYVIHHSGVSTLNFSEEQLFAILQILSNQTASRYLINDSEKQSFKIMLSFNPIPEQKISLKATTKREFEAWQKDKGIKKLTPEHRKEFEKDYVEMFKFLLSN